MEKLIHDVKHLDGEASKRIENRLGDFNSFRNKSSKAWFSELCFCLLTANSKAKTALEIEKELGINGFCECSRKDLTECIKRNKHRFHNNKAKYIEEAREHLDIKKKIRNIVGEKGELEAREWLAKNIKGLGFKESSHFMRNVGFTDLAIVDRHIINILLDYDIITSRPKSITKTIYLDIENKLAEIASSLGFSQAKLDLYLWYMKTGEILK